MASDVNWRCYGSQGEGGDVNRAALRVGGGASGRKIRSVAIW